MPLAEGKSPSTISQNIDEMVKAYKRTGYIGNTKPKNDSHAQQIAAAAAYRKAGKR